MNKKCKQCGTEFVPTNDNRGHEQLYCSKKCGQISARIRREERLKNSNNEYQLQQPTPEFNQGINLAQQQMGGIISNGRSDTTTDISSLEKLYEAKIENNYLKLKCDNLEEKIRLLQIEVNDLTTEIEAMEIDEELEQPNNGFLGSIFDQFKADPINTVAMVKMMFQNLTAKNESNEQTKTSKASTTQSGKP